MNRKKTIEDFMDSIPSLKSLNHKLKLAFEHLDCEIEQTRSEDDDNIYIHIALAGMSKDDITIEVTEFLTIKGTVNENAKYACFHKNFMRRFHLDEKINKNDISADMVDGILTITLPKIVEKKSSAIKIDIK